MIDLNIDEPAIDFLQKRKSYIRYYAEKNNMIEFIVFGVADTKKYVHNLKKLSYELYSNSSFDWIFPLFNNLHGDIDTNEFSFIYVIKPEYLNNFQNFIGKLLILE